MFIRLFLACSLLFLTACDNHARDKRDIADVYGDIERCNNAKDGKTVVELLTSDTFRRYERLIKLGLDGSPDEVKALPPNDKFEVLLMRLMASREDISKLDGRGYVIFATSKGWYITPPSERSVDFVTKIKISSSGNDAHGQLVSDGYRTDVRLHFVKEGGSWRFDETAAVADYDDAIRRHCSAERISVDKFVFDWLEEQTGKPVPNSIWHPMIDEANSLFAPPPK